MIKSIHLETIRIRDALMRITLLLNEKNKLEYFVSNLTDLKVLLDSFSNVTGEFFDNCFIETDFTSAINNADWISGVKSFICFGWKLDKNTKVFNSDTQVITEE